MQSILPKEDNPKIPTTCFRVILAICTRETSLLTKILRESAAPDSVARVLQTTTAAMSLRTKQDIGFTYPLPANHISFSMLQTFLFKDSVHESILINFLSPSPTLLGHYIILFSANMFLASSRSVLESPKVLMSVALLLIAYALRLVFPKRGKEVDDSPMLGQPGDPDFQAALSNGYQQVKS